MLRAVGMLAGGAVVGFLALKLLGLLLLPLLGLVFGAVMFALKIALIGGLIYMAYKLFRRWGEERGSEAG
jgi:threonine/homoserine/homoserine lactone efflux protein